MPKLELQAGAELDLEGRSVNRCGIDVNAQEAQPLNHPLHPPLIVVRLENRNRVPRQIEPIENFSHNAVGSHRPVAPAAIVFEDHPPAVAQIRKFLRIEAKLPRLKHLPLLRHHHFRRNRTIAPLNSEFLQLSLQFIIEFWGFWRIDVALSEDTIPGLAIGIEFLWGPRADITPLIEFRLPRHGSQILRLNYRPERNNVQH